MGIRRLLSFDFGVFDLDGTIVNSVPTSIAAYADALAAHGISDPLTPSEASALTNETMVTRVQRAFADRGTPVSREFAESVRHDFQTRFLAANVPLRGGVRELLAALGGLRLFVSSATTDAVVWKRIVHGGLGGSFTMAYGSTAVPKGQAHIDLFARFCDVSSDEFAARGFYLGDTTHDMRIAAEAGLYAIGVLGSTPAEELRAAGAQRVVKSPEHLLEDIA